MLPILWMGGHFSLRTNTFRTLGATVVLSGLAVAAVLQIESGDPSALELAAAVDSTPTSSTPVVTTPAEFEYRIGLLSGVSTDNFWEYIGDKPTAWNAYVLGPTKPALFAIDPVDNTLVPDVAVAAASPTWDEDGWRARVELRDDISWSDGRPVSAVDVAYTFATVRRLGLGGGWADAYPAEVESIVADSDTALRIEFSSRPDLRLWPYALGLAPIMPAHVWEPLTESIETDTELYGLENVADLSGGPLQIVALDEDRIEAADNPGYPGEGPDSVIYTVYPNEAAAIAGLESGEIDTVLSPNGLSPKSAERLESAEGLTVSKSPANSVRYLGFNLDREPMSDPAFRQAIASLIDLSATTRSLVPDASAAFTLISPANRSWFDDEVAQSLSSKYEGSLEERLTRTISELVASGYAWTTSPSIVSGALVAGTGLTIDGVGPAPLTIVTPGDEYDPARSDYTGRIESILEGIGFDVRPVITDFDTVIDLAFTRDDQEVRQFDMYVLGWTLGNPALPDFYRQFFASEGPVNSTGYSDPEFETQLARYEQAADVAAAKAALWEMEKTLAGDLPYLPLYHPVIVEAYRSDRVVFNAGETLGGLQGRLGGIGDLTPAR